MYHKELIGQFTAFISSRDGCADKSRLQNEAQQAFGFVKDRSVFYCDWFAVRFCKAASRNFGNTVLSLSALHRYDNLPFLVCLVTPARNYLLLANTTFLRKISHSSQELRRDNIKGASMAATSCESLRAWKMLPKTSNFFSARMKTIPLRKILIVW